jgi:glycogen operon protein
MNRVPDVAWYGTDLAPPAWDDPALRTLCVQLDGNEEASGAGDYRLFLILNADHRLQYVRLPALPSGKRWRRIIDTSLDPGQDFTDPGAEVTINPTDHYLANGRSTVVLVG